jgi:hypothetical protein
MKEIVLAYDFESVTGGEYTNDAHCYKPIEGSKVVVQYYTKTPSGLVKGGRGDKHSDYKPCPQGDTPTWKHAEQFGG